MNNEVQEIDTRYEESDLKTEDFQLVLQSKEYALYRPKFESTENTEGEFFILDKWRKGVIEVRHYDIEGFLKIISKILDIFSFDDETFFQSEEGKKFMDKLRRDVKDVSK